MPAETEVPQAQPLIDDEVLATLRYSPAGRTTPRPASPPSALVLLAAVLIAVVGTANVTLRRSRRPDSEPFADTVCR
jgi:hypothetical protein